MHCECNMSSKLAYIYFNNTLILQRGNAPCFAALMQPAPSATSYLLVTSPLQRLPARMYGLSNTSHACHTRQWQQLHILIYKCQAPANTQSLPAITANAAAMSILQAAEQYLCSINTWPSSIIFSIFAETPSQRVIEYLTEFFAGNALPNTLAYRLYSVCNPEAANDLVRQLF